MAYLDKEIQEAVLQRSGGKCECIDADHDHGAVCGVKLDAECHFVYASDMPSRLRVVCYSCYKKKKALRKK